MDIGSIPNLNISYDQPLQKDNILSEKLDIPSQQNNQPNKIKTDNFQQQFKEVSKKEETQETERTFSEVSTNNTSSAQNKNTHTETLKTMQQILQKSDEQSLPTPKENVAQLLGDNQLNKLKQQNKNHKTNLQTKLLGESKESSLSSLTLSSSVGLFKSWLRKVKTKPGSSDDIEDVEDLDSDIFGNNESSKTENNPDKAAQIKNNSLVKQQKLFSLNIQSSIRYLKNLKTFNKRYSPEMLIYNEESGFVDAQETLECLGWDDIEKFSTRLDEELNLKKLKEIHNNGKILNAADGSGLSVYKANHPLHSEKRMTLAIESLTGDITMIENLDDLEKLELKGKIYKIYNVAS